MAFHPFYYSMAGVCLDLQFCYAAWFLGGTAASGYEKP
jgi:hypothetical protein